MRPGSARRRLPCATLSSWRRFAKPARALGIVEVGIGPAAIVLTFEPRRAEVLRQRRLSEGAWSGERLVIPENAAAGRVEAALSVLERLAAELATCSVGPPEPGALISAGGPPP
jgi:hypothetical protein